MKVRALILFDDLQSKKIRKPGEIFDVTQERYEEINSTSHGILIEAIEKGNMEEETEEEPEKNFKTAEENKENKKEKKQNKSKKTVK